MESFLDIELIDDLRGLAATDVAFLETLLNEFLKYSQKDLADLRSFQADPEVWNNSTDVIKNTLHNLQGRSANIGLKALAAKMRDWASDPMSLQVDQISDLITTSAEHWCEFCQLEVKNFKHLLP